MTGLTWRNRTAEAIMLGASLYNQQVQLQQLYIRQKTNQLTLSGQASFPSKSSDWLRPDFRGDISATINSLGDFTSLFGANSGDFAGAIPISKPITFAAVSLPLRIGESWTEFSMTPLKVSLSFINLSLENAPRWPGLGNFRSGILSGALEVSGTLQRPTFEGEIDLIDGQTKDESLGFTGISGRVRLDGNHGLIDFLRIIRKDADVSFRGEVEVRDADDLTITLTSNLPMFDVTSYPLDCVSRVMVSRIDTMFAPIVSEIKLAGGLFDHIWTITLR